MRTVIGTNGRRLVDSGLGVPLAPPVENLRYPERGRGGCRRVMCWREAVTGASHADFVV
jgi:hypothetical protein